jgi:hypothetical protein
MCHWQNGSGFSCLGSLCCPRIQGNSVVALAKIVGSLLALAPCAIRKEIERNLMCCFAAQAAMANSNGPLVKMVESLLALAPWTGTEKYKQNLYSALLPK